MNDKNNEDNNFTWNDTVYIRKNAPQEFFPGKIGVVCGMSKIESEQIAQKYCMAPNEWIYTVEFEDGSDIQVAECYLEKYTASDPSD